MSFLEGLFTPKFGSMKTSSKFRKQRAVLKSLQHIVNFKIDKITDFLKDAGEPLVSEEYETPKELEEVLEGYVDGITDTVVEEPENTETPTEETAVYPVNILPRFGANLQGAMFARRNKTALITSEAFAALLSRSNCPIIYRDGGSNINESQYEVKSPGMALALTIEGNPQLVENLSTKDREKLQKRAAQDEKETENLIYANTKLVGESVTHLAADIPTSMVKSASMEMPDSQVREMLDDAIAIAGPEELILACDNEINGHIAVLEAKCKAAGIPLPQKGTEAYFDTLFSLYTTFLIRMDAIAQEYRIPLLVVAPPTSGFFPEDIDESQGDKAAKAIQNANRQALQNGCFIESVKNAQIKSPFMLDIHRYTQVDLSEKEVITDPAVIAERVLPGLSEDYVEVFDKTIVQFYRGHFPGVKFIFGESGIRKSAALSGNTVAGAIDIFKRSFAALEINRKYGENVIYGICHQTLYGEPKYGLIQYDENGISLTTEGEAFAMITEHLTADMELQAGDGITSGIYISPYSKKQLWFDISGEFEIHAWHSMITNTSIGQLHASGSGWLGTGVGVYNV